MTTAATARPDPGAACAPRDAGAAWIAGALLACAAAALHATLRPGEILHGLADESLLVPLARRAWDPALFRGDTWLDFAARVFGRAYSWLLGGVLRAFDDPVTAGRALALPFHTAFLAGCFRIVDAASGRRVAWAATAALTAVPFALAAATGGDAPWPLAAGASLPRDLVFALLPWAWVLRENAIASGKLGRRVLVGLGVGLLANVHPLTALHAIALFFVLDAIRTPWKRALRDAVAVGFVSVHGAVPYLLQWGNFPRTAGSAPREVMLWRIEGIGAWTPAVWAARVEIAAWFVAAAVVLSRRRAEGTVRGLRTASLVALTGCALAPLLNALTPGIQFDRLNRFAMWLAAIVVAAALPAALRARDRVAVVAAAACLALGIAGRPLVAAATGADRGPVEWAARRVEVRMGRGDEAAGSPVPERPRAGEPSSDAARAAAFRDVCAWVRANTAPGTVILVPPEDFGAFRAYAARPVQITRKDGGFALSFLGGRGNDWFREYAQSVESFAGPAAGLAEEAQLHRARVAVLDSPRDVPAGWTEAHASGPYRVFLTGVR